MHRSSTCAHFGMGNMGQAQRHAELALQFAEQNSEPQMQGLARSWLGRVIAKTEPERLDVVQEHLLHGKALLEELGIRYQSGWGHLWLGELYSKSGRRDEALASLHAAESLFRDMGMDYWLGEAQGALANL